jgi:nucleoside permease NupC
LSTEWAVIAVIVAGISWFVTDNRKAASYITILLAGVVYLGFGALLAKLGYSRKSLGQLRAEAAVAPPRSAGNAGSPPGAKAKPAPTKRTSSGPSNRPNKKKR